MKVNGRRVNSATVAAYAPVAGFPDAQRATESSAPPPPPPTPIHTLGATYWYDGLDFAALADQTLPNRVGVDDCQLGSTSGADFNDPLVVLGPPAHMEFVQVDDFLQLPASATPTTTNTTGAMTVLVIASDIGTTSERALFSSGAGNDQGFDLFTFAGALYMRHGSSVGQRIWGAGLNNGAIRAYGGTVNNGAITAYERTLGISTTYNLATTAPNHIAPRVGTRAHNTTRPWAGDIYAVVIFPTALSLADLDTAADYLLGLR